ncbi:MAG: c-type cytochrome [Pirellulaceae bacterium]
MTLYHDWKFILEDGLRSPSYSTLPLSPYFLDFMKLSFAFTLLVCMLVSSVQAGDDRSSDDAGLDAAVDLLELMLDVSPDAAGGSIEALTNKLAEGGLSDARKSALRKRLSPLLAPLIKDFQSDELHQSAVLLAGELAIPEAQKTLRSIALDKRQPTSFRSSCLRAMGRYGSESVIPVVDEILTQQASPTSLQEASVDAIASLPADEASHHLLAIYPRVDASVAPRIVDILSGRKVSAQQLLEAIASGRFPPGILGANQAMRIKALGDDDLTKRLESVWGSIRSERNPQRTEVLRAVEQLARAKSGDPERGWIVYRRVCAQCHQLHGEGHAVGPEITRNGRGNFEQLLSNILDPNLVIGTGFVSTTVLTVDGQVIAGVVTEKSDDKIVLKVQGGRVETILSDDIESERQTGLSLMPEGLEKQMTEQELLDLLALLSLEMPPGSSGNRTISGTPANLHP